MDAAVQERLQRLRIRCAATRSWWLCGRVLAWQIRADQCHLLRNMAAHHACQRWAYHLWPHRTGATTTTWSQFAPAAHRHPFAAPGLAEWRLRPVQKAHCAGCEDADQNSARRWRWFRRRRVTVEQARALGFGMKELPEDNPAPDAQGLVEVPQWRYAHQHAPPLVLKQVNHSGYARSERCRGGA